MSINESLQEVAATVTGAGNSDNDLVCRSAFALLLRSHERVTVTDIVAETGGSRGWVEAALAEFDRLGAIDIDTGGRVEGIAGLTIRPTVHELQIGSDLWHTWCALDAIGIPVALEVDADVSTSCPACGRRLSISIQAGHIEGASGTNVLFLPSAQCSSHLIDDFCSSASLFCGRDHLTLWANKNGAVGVPSDLGEVEEIGRAMWQRFNESA